MNETQKYGMRFVFYRRVSVSFILLLFGITKIYVYHSVHVVKTFDNDKFTLMK